MATTIQTSPKSQKVEVLADEPTTANAQTLEMFNAGWDRIGVQKKVKESASQDLRSDFFNLSRRARDGFEVACAAKDEDQAETSYEAMVTTLSELWEYAAYRDRPFRDLLGLIEATLRYRSTKEFIPEQRKVILDAFSDLSRWHLDQSRVDEHLEQFMVHNLDIESPLRAPKGKKVRISIEIIEDDTKE